MISHHFWASYQNGGGDRPRKVQFSEFQKLRDLDLDFGSGRGHTDGHIRSRLPTHQIISKSEKSFCGRTDGRTDMTCNIRTSLYSEAPQGRWRSSPTACTACCGDKAQWILMMSTSHKLRSPSGDRQWGRNAEIWLHMSCRLGLHIS